MLVMRWSVDGSEPMAADCSRTVRRARRIACRGTPSPGTGHRRGCSRGLYTADRQDTVTGDRSQTGLQQGTIHGRQTGHRHWGPVTDGAAAGDYTRPTDRDTVTGDRSQTGLQQGTIHGRQTGHRHRGPVTDGAAAGDYTRPTDRTPSPRTSHRRGCSRGLYTADRQDTVTGYRSQTGLQQGTIHGRQTGHRHRGPVTDGAAAGNYTRPTDRTPSLGTGHRRGCSRGLYTADRQDTVTGYRSQTGLQQGTIHGRQTGHRHRGPVTDGAAAGDYTRPTDRTPSPGTGHRRGCSRGLYTADRQDTVTGYRSQTGLQQGTIHGRQTGHRHRGPVTDGAAAGDYTRPTDGTPSPGTGHRRGCSRELYTADRRDTVTGDRSQTGLQQGTIHGRQTGHSHRGPVTDGAAAGDYTRPTDRTPSPGTGHRRGCSRVLYTADRRDTVTGDQSQTGLQQGTIHGRQTGHRHRGPVTDGAAAGDYTWPTDGTPSPGTSHRRGCSRELYTADRRDTVTGDQSQTGLQQGTIHGRQTGHRHRGPVTDVAAAGDYTRPTDGTPSPRTSHRRGCSRGLYTADRQDTVTGDRSQTGLQQRTIHGRQTGHRHRGPVTDGAAAGDYTRPTDRTPSPRPVTDGAAAGDYTRPTDRTPSPGTGHRRGCSRGLYTADRQDTVTGYRSQTGLQQGTIHGRQTGHRHRGPVTDGAAAGDYTRPTDRTPSPGTGHRRGWSRGLYTADRQDTVTGYRSQTGLQQGTIHGRQTGHRHRGPVTDGAAAGDYTRPTDRTPSPGTSHRRGCSRGLYMADRRDPYRNPYSFKTSPRSLCRVTIKLYGGLVNISPGGLTWGEGGVLLFFRNKIYETDV